MQLHHSVVEQWRQTARCRHCSSSWNAIQAVTAASDRIISLFEAASHAYSLEDYITDSPDRTSSGQLFPPNLLGSTSFGVTCTRAQMTLGDFVLQDDEASILAGQVIYKSLVTHYGLLEDLRYNNHHHYSPQDRLDQSSAGGTSIQCTIDRLLRMLGRMHQDPLMER
ncbi:hypothetical protein CPLU01_12668 [Colletotrichum plurivorum]|uniref:Uncharacterized protein n=1 Tax=Colletotrichum plurivorum TaxID=2175906 RepID=A0A8H6JWT3_9PEZI|nr:hypothetical protein CPLU01_12668 [Colletotrichum plurivorum]